MVDEKARPFYSIPPIYSPEKLIDMIDTNDSASNHSESEFIEYVSDSEGEEKGEKRGFSQFDSDEDEVAEEGKRKEMKTVKRFYDEEEDSSTMTRSLEEREEPNWSKIIVDNSYYFYEHLFYQLTLILSPSFYTSIHNSLIKAMIKDIRLETSS